MTRIYDITVPAQIGMQSYAKEVDALRVTMAKASGSGYVEFPISKRVYLSPTGQRVDHAVYVFRVEVDDKNWRDIVEELRERFYGRAPYTIAVFQATTAYIGAAPAEAQGELTL